MKIVSITEAKARFFALLAEVERTGIAVTITRYGRPIAVLNPVSRAARKFGQCPNFTVPDTFNDPLTESEIALWQGFSAK